MKILLSLMIAGATLLTAGGDILPVNVVTQFERPMVAPAMRKSTHVMRKSSRSSRGCYKPNIVKCPDCVDVAELCPDEPNLPIAQTEVCEGSVNGR